MKRNCSCPCDYSALTRRVEYVLQSVNPSSDASAGTPLSGMVVLELDNHPGDGLRISGSEANMPCTLGPAPSRVAPAMAVCARVACYDLRIQEHYSERPLVWPMMNSRRCRPRGAGSSTRRTAESVRFAESSSRLSSAVTVLRLRSRNGPR